MWGAISYARKPQLVRIPGNLNAARYRDEVLTPHMLPAMNLSREVFEHDNTQSHTARAIVDFLDNQSVTVLPVPSKSPDLNRMCEMISIDACAVANQQRILCKNYSRLLS